MYDFFENEDVFWENKTHATDLFGQRTIELIKQKVAALATQKSCWVWGRKKIFSYKTTLFNFLGHPLSLN